MDDRSQVLAEQAEALCLTLLSANQPLGMQAVGAEFLASTQKAGPYESYDVFPVETYNLLSHVTMNFGLEGARKFLRYVLTRACADTLKSTRFGALPPTVAREHFTQLARIVADTDVASPWLDLSSDLYQKEFGLATMRLYAAGAQLVDFRCGVPRSIIWRGGLTRILRTAGALVRAGGFRPYFQIHTHDFMLDKFNPAGWDTCYICCAELYAIHPAVLGMFGSSWFYDPQLDSVSPRLGYLREIPVKGGAHLFLWEHGGQALHNALSTSPTRRKLHEEGRYFPASFMLMWPRKQQIAWARAFPESQV